jgi:hypothetical protein
MKIQRTIERRIEVTADEVYAALAAKFDLSSDPSASHFDMGGDTIRDAITLVSVSAFEPREVE